MSYTIYIAEDCHDCDKVMEALKNRASMYKVYNVDTETGVSVPIPLHIYPALFKNNELLAYGIDIIEYLKEYP